MSNIAPNAVDAVNFDDDCNEHLDSMLDAVALCAAQNGLRLNRAAVGFSNAEVGEMCDGASVTMLFLETLMEAQLSMLMALPLHPPLVQVPQGPLPSYEPLMTWRTLPTQQSLGMTPPRSLTPHECFQVPSYTANGAATAAVPSESVKAKGDTHCAPRTKRQAHEGLLQLRSWNGSSIS